MSEGDEVALNGQCKDLWVKKIHARSRWPAVMFGVHNQTKNIEKEHPLHSQSPVSTGDCECCGQSNTISEEPQCWTSKQLIMLSNAICHIG